LETAIWRTVPTFVPTLTFSIASRISASLGCTYRFVVFMSA